MRGKYSEVDQDSPESESGGLKRSSEAASGSLPASTSAHASRIGSPSSAAELPLSYIDCKRGSASAYCLEKSSALARAILPIGDCGRSRTRMAARAFHSSAG